MDFHFFMPVQVFGGEGCVHRQGARLRELGKRCLIITGGTSAQASGALTDMLEVLQQNGVDATVFPSITANPTVSQCQAAAAAAESWRADFLVGIGGGSVMDATKAAAWLLANSIGDSRGLLAASLRRPPVPFALVGTTAGTGSEVTATAVVTDDATGQKHSVKHPSCYARYAFADARYTASLPRAATVSTALDAFSHTVEGFLNPHCDDTTTALAMQALPLLREGLQWLAGNDGLPDAALREKLLTGSLWAGLVLNAVGTAFPHPLGYVLTENFGVPHGMACAVLLPALIRRGERFAPERTAVLLELFGGEERCCALLDSLVRVNVSLSPEQIAAYAARWNGLKNFERTPGGFSAAEAVALFTERFGEKAV